MAIKIRAYKKRRQNKLGTLPFVIFFRYSILWQCT